MPGVNLTSVKIPRRLRGYAYLTFYRLPVRVRRRLVRLVVRKYLVGGVAVVHDTEAADPGRLLLLLQPPGRGWGLPAGLLKKKEPPAEGAARELFEESGVRIDPDDLVPANPNAIVHPLGWVDMVFFGGVPASTTTLTVDGGEVLEARWFPMDDLPPLTRSTELLLGVYGIGPAARATPAASSGDTSGAASGLRNAGRPGSAPGDTSGAASGPRNAGGPGSAPDDTSGAGPDPSDAGAAGSGGNAGGRA